jgi:hypothetical protein
MGLCSGESIGSALRAGITHDRAIVSKRVFSGGNGVSPRIIQEVMDGISAHATLAPPPKSGV